MRHLSVYQSTGSTMIDNIIHIGFPKTGTTSLQKGYFLQHPDFIFQGQPCISDKLRRLVELDILTKSELEYDHETVTGGFQDEIAVLRKQKPGKVFVFSHEALTYRTESFTTDMAEIARRLHDIFGEAKIVITIRRQDEMFCSLYQQAVQGGCYVSFSNYLDYYMGVYYMSFLPLLKYIPLINCYEKLFGKENVLVQCFEKMKADPNSYFSNLSRFCSVKNIDITCSHENKGFGRRGVFLQRIANRIFPYDSGRPLIHPSLRRSGEKQKLSFRVLYKTYTNLLTKGIDSFLTFAGKIRVPRKWLPIITDLYADTNKQLCEEYDLPLKKYGYPGI